MTTKDPLGIVGSIIAEKYRIERLVGEGGFAVVYRAQHTIWNQPVAIKFFNGLSSAPVDQREEFRNQFIQEGALLTELSSQTASIVQARDVGEYTSPYGQWMPYMVLEWLDGVALDTLLEREHASGIGPWTVEQVVTLLSQVANALDVAHGKGIAHRDIKPANIFVLGAAPRLSATLKVLDFGVAKMMSDNTQLKAAMAKTGVNITSFTPQYGAPEQFSRSYGATGPWTDVYALALVAVEMLTGKPALDGEDIVQLAFATGNPERRPTPLQVVLDAGPAHGLRAVILRYFNAAGADPDGEIGEQHDPETHLIPLILNAASESNGPVTVFGTDYPTPDGTCIRDYVHVQDLANAHVLGLKYLQESAGVAAFNLGTGRGYSVREIIDAARRVTGRDLRIVEGPRRPGDPPELVADATRARRILGWRPDWVDIESVIETAWRWHCGHAVRNPWADGARGLSALAQS